LEAQGDTANRTLLLCEEGRAWEAASDLAATERCWQQAERLSRTLGRDPIRADVLLQLGRLDHLRGNLGSALDRYAMALTCILPGGQSLELELRRTLVLLDLNQWEQARFTASQLLEAWPPDQLPEEIRPLAAMVRALLEGSTLPGATDEFNAYQEAMRGNVEAAIQLYDKARAATPSLERQARLTLALGLLAMIHTSRTDTDAWLSQAEALARSLNMQEVLWRALQARGQVAAELNGDHKRARPLFEEAILIAEMQAARLVRPTDIVAHRQQRHSAVHYLLRSACRRNEPDKVFYYQELERGRLVLDLWQTAGPVSGRFPLFERPEVVALELQLKACMEELLTLSRDPDKAEQRLSLLHCQKTLELQRDRLFEKYLGDRNRQRDAVLPALPELSDLQQRLPTGTVYVAASLVGEELFLLVARHGEPARVICGAGTGAEFKAALAGLRTCLTNQMARYRSGLALGRTERAELDGWLEQLGHGPLGDALAQALQARPQRERVLWAPDQALHGLPIHALRRDNRYLIEDHEFVTAYTGSLFVHQAQTRRRRRTWWRPVLCVAEAPEGMYRLPKAGQEAKGVAATFLFRRLLHGAAATRAAVRRCLARACVAHFACHADFDAQHPLAAPLRLPSGDCLRAAEWLDEPVYGLPLVTLSACQAAELAPVHGHELFGLVTGLLAGGVRAVLAGLWEVADEETMALMWRFYRHRLTNDLATALALAQRDMLTECDSSPLFWAAFALFGDAAALPVPGFSRRGLARMWQRWHARRFPLSSPLLATA
jgi:tetratricopeptide (TPR) repeat protein